MELGDPITITAANDLRGVDESVYSYSERIGFCAGTPALRIR